MKKKVFSRTMACVLVVMLIFTAVSGNLSAIAENDATQELPDWAFVEWTKADAPITHLGLSTANSSDGNWPNYRYVGQSFVPASKNISGIKIPMNLTSNDAKIHIEIRRDMNGSALFTKEFNFTSFGDGRFEYTFDFGENVSVTPGDKYYAIWWLVERHPGAVCIVYGTDVGMNKEENTGCVWAMKDGSTTENGDPVFVDYPNVVFSFALIFSEVAEPVTEILWNSFDNGGVSLEASRCENGQTVSGVQIEGTSAYSFVGLNGNANDAQMFIYLHPDTAYPDRSTIDISAMKHVSFDLYVSEQIISSKIIDAGFNISNTDAWDAGGALFSSEVFKNHSWKQGWNHFVVAIDQTYFAAGFDAAALKRGRIYMIYDGDFSGVTFMIDDLRFLDQSKLDEAKARCDAKDVIAMIHELPVLDTLKFEDGEAIQQAYDAYQNLTAIQQEYVFNRNNLMALKTAYDDLSGAAVNVINLIEALPTVESNIFANDVAKVRMAYQVLPESQKVFVTNYEKLEQAEKALGDLAKIHQSQISPKDLSKNAASFGQAYGSLLGWKIKSGQPNHWIAYNLNNTFGVGKYKLGIKARYTGLGDSRPALSIKCADRTTGEDEKFKWDIGAAEYDAAEKDANGFATFYLDVNVTEDIANHHLEGGILAYNEFHENMEIIIDSIFWVDADDTDLVYYLCETKDFPTVKVAKGLDGTLAYNDEEPIQVDYAADKSKPVDDEPGYIFTDLSCGELPAGKYFADLAYVADEGNDVIFELEIYQNDEKIASQLVTEQNFAKSAKNTDGEGYLQVPFALNKAANVTLKVYQFNGGSVSYRYIDLYQTEDDAQIPVEDPLKDFANLVAQYAANEVPEEFYGIISNAKVFYDAMSDEEKALVSSDLAEKIDEYYFEINSSGDNDFDYGDVDGDSVIDAKDALLILQAAVDKVTLTPDKIFVADVNGDNALNAVDALLVLQRAVDKIEKFPVE